MPIFLSGVVAFAFAIRVIVVACLLSQVSSHQINYNDFGWESWEMGWTARSIFLGQGFSSPFLPVTGATALVPPLYPYLLAGCFRLFGLNTVKVAFAVLSLNSLFSALTCLPLFFLARRVLNARLARLAALAWAVYPFAVYFSADRVWDYALTSLLFTCCLLVAQSLPERSRWGWAGFGALYGVTALSNPSVVSLLPFLLCIAMYRARVTGRAWLTGALCAALAFAAVCAPWQMRNHRVMHASFFVRDGFWLEFYAGNNGDTHESNSASAHPASNPVEMQRYQAVGEIGYMAEKRDMALTFVRQHPGFFAVATLRRIARFWTGYWSFSRSYLRYEPFDLPNVPFCLVLSFFTFRGLVRWWRRDRSSALPYLLAVLVFPLPYYITHASMDYRQPLEPVVILFVTVGLFGRARQATKINPALVLEGEQAMAA
ncbi:MAG: glycosyltransferase family 39 protein [Rhodospirillales bacterium]|nr:glycosyltransferase family 39 protein [Acetobacter sp.]